MKHVLRLSGDTYRTDLAAIRKSFALSRAGNDICVRLECAGPDTPREDWMEIYIGRHDLWLNGLRNRHGGFKFADGCPLLDDVVFTRTLRYSLSYKRLDAWNAGNVYRGMWSFHRVVSALSAVTQDSYIGHHENHCIALLIFMVPEALRFWPIDQAIAQAISGRSYFRLTDWQDKVTSWRQSSEGAHNGFPDGVTMPWLRKL